MASVAEDITRADWVSQREAARLAKTTAYLICKQAMVGNVRTHIVKGETPLYFRDDAIQLGRDLDAQRLRVATA